MEIGLVRTGPNPAEDTTPLKEYRHLTLSFKLSVGEARALHEACGKSSIKKATAYCNERAELGAMLYGFLSSTYWFFEDQREVEL